MTGNFNSFYTCLFWIKVNFCLNVHVGDVYRTLISVAMVICR